MAENQTPSDDNQEATCGDPIGEAKTNLGTT